MAKLRLPKGTEAPSVADFSALGPLEGPAAGAITLLSKGKMLENILNIIEDLKGGPLEGAADALAEKAPHVMGHLGEVRPAQAGRELAAFWPDNAQVFFGPIKGRGVGDITVHTPSLNTGFRTDPGFVLGHEATHAAQSLGKGPARAYAEYQKLLKRPFGYFRHPMEKGANKAGVNLRRAMEGKPRKR